MLVSPANGILADEVDTQMPVRLKHVLPNTLFTIDLTDCTSYVLRDDRSVINTQSFQEWATLEAFCGEVGFTLETTLDGWCGAVLNPDVASC